MFIIISDSSILLMHLAYNFWLLYILGLKIYNAPKPLYILKPGDYRSGWNAHHRLWCGKDTNDRGESINMFIINSNRGHVRTHRAY